MQDKAQSAGLVLEPANDGLTNEAAAASETAHSLQGINSAPRGGLYSVEESIEFERRREELRRSGRKASATAQLQSESQPMTAAVAEAHQIGAMDQYPAEPPPDNDGAEAAGENLISTGSTSAVVEAPSEAQIPPQGSVAPVLSTGEASSGEKESANSNERPSNAKQAGATGVEDLNWEEFPEIPTVDEEDQPAGAEAFAQYLGEDVGPAPPAPPKSEASDQPVSAPDHAFSPKPELEPAPLIVRKGPYSLDEAIEWAQVRAEAEVIKQRVTAPVATQVKAPLPETEATTPSSVAPSPPADSDGVVELDEEEAAELAALRLRHEQEGTIPSAAFEKKADTIPVDNEKSPFGEGPSAELEPTSVLSSGRMIEGNSVPSFQESLARQKVNNDPAPGEVIDRLDSMRGPVEADGENMDASGEQAESFDPRANPSPNSTKVQPGEANPGDPNIAKETARDVRNQQESKPGPTEGKGRTAERAATEGSAPYGERNPHAQQSGGAAGAPNYGEHIANFVAATVTAPLKLASKLSGESFSRFRKVAVSQSEAQIGKLCETINGNVSNLRGDKYQNLSEPAQAAARANLRKNMSSLVTALDMHKGTLAKSGLDQAGLRAANESLRDHVNPTMKELGDLSKERSGQKDFEFLDEKLKTLVERLKEIAEQIAKMIGELFTKLVGKTSPAMSPG